MIDVQLLMPSAYACTTHIDATDKQRLLSMVSDADDTKFWQEYLLDIIICKQQSAATEVRLTLALVAPGWVTAMPSPKAMGSGPMPLVSWNRMAEPRPLLSAVRGAPCIVKKQ